MQSQKTKRRRMWIWKSFHKISKTCCWRWRWWWWWRWWWSWWWVSWRESSSKEIYLRYSGQKCKRIKPEWKRLKIISTKIKRSRLIKKKKTKQEKTPKTWEGPSFVEDIKVKMQASVEKEGILLKVEAKFISYVNNCIRVTYQEAI